MSVSSRGSKQLALISFAAGAICAAICTMPGPALADGVFKPIAAITLPNGQKIQSFDIGYVDPVLGLYVLGDRTNGSVDVVNTSNNTLVKQITGGFAGPTASNDNAGPDGVMITNHNLIWVGDAPGLLKIFDLSGNLVKTISTNAKTRVDEMCWDPIDQVAMVTNNAESPPFSTFVSITSLNVLGRVAYDGLNGTPKATNGAEQCQYSPQTGKFLIAIPEVNGPGDNTGTGGIAVHNPLTLQVEQTFLLPQASCRGPQGTAVGPNFQLAINCNATTTSMIMDVRNGSTIATLPQGTGAGDMVWYNPGDNRYFFANSNAGRNNPSGPKQTLAIVDNNAAFTTSIVTTSNTLTGGNHSVAVDPVRNQAYVPIASTSNAGICSSAGGVDSQGCIAVFQNPDDTLCFAGGAPVIQVQNDNSPSFLRTLCLLHAVP